MRKPVEQHLVVKSNSLIQASYKLTLNEQRLILQAVSGLNSKLLAIRPGLNQVENIRITAAEFGAMWKLSTKDAYRALKEATENLYEQTIKEINGKHVKKMRWVGAVEYHDGEGWASLSFTSHVTPHLTNLSAKFTEYRIGQVANLRKPYSIRLFEWCVQFMDTGWMQVSLNDLIQRLGVEYKLYNDVRRKVIEPAIKELRAKSNLDISYTAVKQGKKVVAIRFTFKEATQRQLGLEVGIDQVERDLLETEHGQGRLIE